MTEYIGTLYDRTKKLKAEEKDRELVLFEEHIAFMEGDFRERQKRLLQASQQEDLHRRLERSGLLGGLFT